ncbi:hypothetical protein GC174_02730 [bacterium]|nr:hypothetical protein [bacterium]
MPSGFARTNQYPKIGRRTTSARANHLLHASPSASASLSQPERITFSMPARALLPRSANPSESPSPD